MDSLVIGDTGCSFNFVTLTLGQTATPLTRRCLSNLMRSLGTATEKKDEISMKFDKIGFSISDAVEEVLREWRTRESDKATLGLFVLHLRDCSLVSHADELVKKYVTNNPGVGSFEMPVSENILQRNISNLRAINGTYQHDMKCNEKKAQVSTSSSTTDLLSMQTKRKIKKNLAIVIRIAVIAFLLGLGLYFGIPASKNAYEQNTPKLIAEKATTPKHLQEQHDEITYETPPIGANLERNYDITLPFQDKSTTSSLNLLVLKPIRLSIKTYRWWKNYDWVERLESKETDGWINIFTWMVTYDLTDNDWGGDDYSGETHISKEWLRWNRDFSGFKKEQVIDLTLDGCTSPYFLEAMLEQFYMVKNLTIVNERGSPCSIINHNLNEIEGVTRNRTNKMSLRNLMYINVVNITNGKEIFTSLATWFIMPVVVELKINSITLHGESIFSLRELLNEIRFSVEILDLFNVSWETSLFHNMMFKLIRVYELRIDFLCYKTSECNILGDPPSYLPVLRNFKPAQGYLFLSENNVISKIKEAEYLEYGIHIRKDDSMLNISVFTKHLSNLKKNYRMLSLKI